MRLLQLASLRRVVCNPGAQLVQHLAGLWLVEELVIGAIPQLEGFVRAAGFIHQAARLGKGTKQHAGVRCVRSFRKAMASVSRTAGMLVMRSELPWLTSSGSVRSLYRGCAGGPIKGQGVKSHSHTSHRMQCERRHTSRTHLQVAESLQDFIAHAALGVAVRHHGVFLVGLYHSRIAAQILRPDSGHQRRIRQHDSQ